jgi:hypothetical protein
MRILLVGGTWTVESETVFDDQRRSGLIDKIAIAIKNYCLEHYNSNYAVDLYNGGCYYDLETILNKAPAYDIVFWWANVPDNDLPKIRNVKEVAPRVMLVTSKRNDGDKYSFMELTQRALAAKANMFFEFKKSDSKLFHINVIDPLGCHWYDGCDVTKAIVSAMDRLDFLRSMTRQKTVKSDIQKSEMMSLYFERTGENANRSHIDIPIPYEQEFINIVRKHAETFYTIFNPGKDVKRFLGNASLRPALNIDSTRCMRGMPSFKNENVVFVSQRNIDKQFIDIEHFVPCYMEEGKLYFSAIDMGEFFKDKRGLIAKEDLPETASFKFVPASGGAVTYISDITCHATSFSASNGLVGSDYIYYADEYIKANGGGNFIMIPGAVGQVSRDIDVDKTGMTEHEEKGADARYLGTELGKMIIAADYATELEPIINVKHRELFVTPENSILTLACEIGLVNNKIFYTGSGFGRTYCMATEMGYLEFGNKIALALFPGELYPEVFWDDEITGGANWDGTEWPYDCLSTAVKGVTTYPVSLTNDAIGYVLTDNNFAFMGHIIGDGIADETLSVGKHIGSYLVTEYLALIESL